MGRELWPLLDRDLQEAARDFRQQDVHFQPWAVAAVLLWAARHDRPVSGACQERHWPATRRRPATLPSQPTVSRRSRKAACALSLNHLSGRFQGRGWPALVVLPDGTPLLVGGCSKDPDARFGRGPGPPGRGYKLHAAWGRRPLPEAWEVAPLNEHEIRVAERRLRQRPGGYAVADGTDDATGRYDAAGACHYQLLARQHDANAGRGHHYRSPYRLRCIALRPTPFGRGLPALRPGIERRFGNATAFAGGVGGVGPPAWVRRRGRVERWVWAKPVINAARI